MSETLDWWDDAGKADEVATSETLDWWDDAGKINEFKRRVVGMRVIYTPANTSGSTGVIRDFIIQNFGGRRMPTLIVDFPDVPYKKYALWNIKPIEEQMKLL